MKRIISLIMVVLVTMLTAAGCGSTSSEKNDGQSAGSAAVSQASTAAESSAAGESSSTEGMKIGLSVYDLANPYFVTVAEGAKAKAKELGIELIVNDPKSDAAAQVTAIDNFIAMGVKAIIIAPLDPKACESALQEAKAKGIKIISQSSKADTRDVYVSADEWDMGHVNGAGAGKWLAEKYGKDAKVKVAVLGNDKISTQIARGDGMADGIKEFVPNAVIIRQNANTTAEGQSVTDSLLQANPDLTAITCLNDAGAIGAYSAVQAAGKDNDKFYIGSIDATQEAKDIMKKGGSFRATVDLIPYENGGIDVDLALKLIKGEKVPETYVIPAKLVTQADVK